MSTPIPLTTVKGGINRLRLKGGALKDSLYDLVNGYVTAAKTVQVRPGSSRQASLNALTKGLTSFDGELHVFASESVAVPSGYVLHVLAHPDSPPDGVDPIALEKIHFAEPIMGALYVVAEFDGGDVYHFWLQSGPTWEASRMYKIGDIVTPSTPNGFAYQATRISAPFPSWQPGVERAVNDVVEPTVFNDYYYTVVDVAGNNPASGTVEPEWPLADGAQVIEDTEAVAATGATTTTQPDVDVTPSPDIVDRYGSFTP